MNTQQRARLSAVPLGQLNLRTQKGWREFKRRARYAARISRHGWRTSYPAVGMRFAQKPKQVRLPNKIGVRPRMRWVPKGN